MMRSIRKVIATIVLLSLVVTILASPIALAYLYRAPVTVTENASTAYTMLPVLWDQNNTWLVANGFMSSTANDTRVQTLGGSNKPWMVCDNKTLTAIPVPANSQTNLYFVTGESAASAMDIIFGYGGYATIADAPALRLGGNFTIEQSGYVFTDNWTSKNLVYKQNAFRTFISGATDITSAVTSGWVIPTGHVDPGADWSSEANAYDNNVGTFSNEGVTPSGDWGDFLELTHAAVTIDSVRAYLGGNDPTITQVNIDYFDGAWHDVYQGVFTQGVWATYYLSAVATGVTEIRFSFYDSGGASNSAYVYEGWFGEVAAVATVTGVASGERIVTTTYDGANLVLSVTDSALVHQGNSPQTTAWVGVVPGNANNWVLDQNDVMPYMDYYSHTVGGVEVVRYEPTSIILVTTLPNELNPGTNDAVITWGANPAGVGVTLGSMSSSGQPSVGSTADTSTSDILPVVGGTDWNQDPSITGSLLTNPFRPIVTVVSDNTTLTERQVWIWYGIIFLVFVVVLVGSKVRGHHLITGIAASVAIILLVVWTVFPWFALIVVVLAVFFGLVSERAHSL